MYIRHTFWSSLKKHTSAPLCSCLWTPMTMLILEFTALQLEVICSKRIEGNTVVQLAKLGHFIESNGKKRKLNCSKESVQTSSYRMAFHTLTHFRHGEELRTRREEDLNAVKRTQENYCHVRNFQSQHAQKFRILDACRKKV